MKKIVITGGHHSSALPVILELRKRNPKIEIYWFGHKFSAKGDTNPTLEFREITQLQIKFYELKAGKFYKTFDIFRLLRIPYGFFQALFLLIKLKPDLILSFGGYLAVPTVIAGRILGIKAVTHEQTVVIGYANKLISYFAKKILISWPQTSGFIEKKNVVLTGIPLREEIFFARSSEFKFENELPIIYITGGKIGSHIINDVVYSSLNNLLQKYNIIHQTGDHAVFKDFDKLTLKYQELKNVCRGRYYLRKFVYSDNIGEVFEKAKLIVSRSGAHICSELIALSKPSLLIPIPWVSHNEQELNAKYVVDLGLAETTPEETLTPKTFEEKIDYMFSNIGKYQLKSKINLKNSAELIVNEVEKTYQEK